VENGSEEQIQIFATAFGPDIAGSVDAIAGVENRVCFLILELDRVCNTITLHKCDMVSIGVVSIQCHRKAFSLIVPAGKSCR
jgi:hypothetical protein